MTMPEEINRLVTDLLSNLLLTPDTISMENLRKEGVPENRIKFVGNIMIDTLEANRDKAAQLSIEKIIKDNILKNSVYKKAFGAGLSPSGGDGTRSVTGEVYALITLHRPSNVDTKEVLEPLFNFLVNEVTKDMPIIWPIHPRTQKMLKTFGLWERALQEENLILLNPIGYHEMLRLNMDTRLMLTDSGGLQEECCVLGTPFLTLRWNTERPVTLKEYGGAGVLVGNNVERIRKEYRETLKQTRKIGRAHV